MDFVYLRSFLDLMKELEDKVLDYESKILRRNWAIKAILDQSLAHWHHGAKYYSSGAVVNTVVLWFCSSVERLCYLLLP